MSGATGLLGLGRALRSVKAQFGAGRLFDVPNQRLDLLGGEAASNLARCHGLLSMRPSCAGTIGALWVGAPALSWP